jgi:hypothetical protein
MKTEKLKKSISSKRGKNGGARKGAGMPKGTKIKRTLEREAVMREYKEKILKHADQFFRVQKTLAFGHYEIFIVEHFEDENGKVKRRHVRVEDPQLMVDILDDPESIQGDNYVIVKKIEADKYTLEAMLDRAFGKATQSIDQTVTTITPQDVLKQLRNGTTPE